MNSGERRSKESSKTTLGSQRTTKNRHSDSLKKSQFTIFQGMMKKGDVSIADDKVRTSALQNGMTATAALCTEEFFLRAQCI